MGNRSRGIFCGNLKLEQNTNNILRTRHYGAQTTRTGRVRNELVGIVFADGEIVSNLRWTPKRYDLMNKANQIQPPDPLNEDDVLSAAEKAITELMSQECITMHSPY